MAQPDYVPVTPADKVRPAERLPPAKAWTTSRPGEIAGLRPPAGRRFGVPGPDQGYALTLAARFADQLELGKGESRGDVVAGCVAVAMKRAAAFGRAPMVFDLEWAFNLYGFLGGGPADLTTHRKPLFAAVAHDYDRRRALVDQVSEATVRLTPGQVRERLSDWRSLLGLPPRTG